MKLGSINCQMAQLITAKVFIFYSFSTNFWIGHYNMYTNLCIKVSSTKSQRSDVVQNTSLWNLNPNSWHFCLRMVATAGLPQQKTEMGPLFSFFKSLKTVSQSGLPYLARFFNPVIRSRFSCNCNNSTLSLSLGLGATQNPSFAQEEIFRDFP